MDLFLCHTPLHVLISLLVACDMPERQCTFAVIKDTAGMHDFASSLDIPENVRLDLTPGPADGKNLLESTLIQRRNASTLKKKYARTANRIYLFHDLRAESQAFLNLPASASSKPHFVLLEDGIALYEPHGILPGSLPSILKRKIAFGFGWKHARELGLHPALSEIRCFYPQLLRQNLKHLPANELPISLKKIKEAFRLHGTTHAETSEPHAIIALPHSRHSDATYFRRQVESALNYCDRNNIRPRFKLHPSDAYGLAILENLISSPVETVTQSLPLEIFFLNTSGATALIGSRTSALHIVKKLYPEVTCMYYEDENTEYGNTWKKFFRDIDLPPLNSAT